MPSLDHILPNSLGFFPIVRVHKNFFVLLSFDPKNKRRWFLPLISKSLDLKIWILSTQVMSIGFHLLPGTRVPFGFHAFRFQVRFLNQILRLSNIKTQDATLVVPWKS